MRVEKSDELIVLIDEHGNEIGTAPKLASHHLQTPLHKAFSCYIFDENGRFLVTQRAKGKKVWPGVWTNSVCGHPGPDESDGTAIRRRVKVELGMEVRNILVVLPNYRYTTPPYEGIIENEICPVYFAQAASKMKRNPTEVENASWVKWIDYVEDMRANPDKYSYWAKDQLQKLAGNGVLAKYIAPKY